MSTLRCALLLGLLVASACNQVLGLDQTRSVNPRDDADDDTVPDAEDNCIAITNPDQADADDDDVGDACDGCDGCVVCATGPDHDEDGDKIPDGCDVCPALADPAQANADGDELGDACDAGPPARRLWFDGFGTLGAEWLASGGLWVVTEDSVGPQEGSPAGTTYQLQHATRTIASGARWALEVGILAPPPGRKRGVFLGTSRFCFLERDMSGAWRVDMTGTRSAFIATTLAPIVRVRLSPSANDAGVTCEVVGGPPELTATTTLGPVAYPVVASLTTNDTGPQYAYIEALAE